LKNKVDAVKQKFQTERGKQLGDFREVLAAFEDKISTQIKTDSEN
jgi:hypothetical protein